MSNPRVRKIADRIQVIVAEMLERRIKDPRLGFVTVTDVKTSADLRHARVYVSVLGTEEEREQTLEGLRSAHGVLQRRVAGELRMKRTPTLEFEYDPTTDRAMRLEQILGDEAPE